MNLVATGGVSPAVRVAISGLSAPVDDGAAIVPATCASASVLSAVVVHGAVPFVAPICASARLANDVIGMADALVLTGGHDILVGGQPHRPDRTDAARDESDLHLLTAARAQGVPVLGICRGMQLMAASAGGELAPVPARVAAAHRGPTAHLITVDADSRLAALAGAGATLVPTLHHFAVRKTGEHRVVASAEDGVAEAIEHPQRWELGVQWHPEVSADELSVAVWTALIDAARNRRGFARERLTAS